MMSAELRRNMRRSIMEGALATSMGSILSGVVLTSFALALGANRWQIGLLAALPTLGNVSQLLGAYLLEGRWNRKPLCVALLTLARIVWLPLFLFCWWQPSWLPAHGVSILIGVVALSSMLGGMGGVVWLSWIRDLVPAAERVSFLVRRNQWDTILSLGLGIAVSLVVDRLQSPNPQAYAGFVWALGTGIFCGLLSLAILSTIPDPGMQRVASYSAGKLLGEPLRDSNFRRLMGFYVCWNWTSQMAAPFFAVYLLQRLELSLGMSTALVTVGSLAGLAASGFWARLSRRFGTKPVLWLALCIDWLFPLSWLLVERDWWWILPVIYLLQLTNSPIATSPNNLLLAVIPTRNASAYIATFHGTLGLVSAAAALTGGLLAHQFSTVQGAPGGWTWGGLKLVFLLAALGRLVSLTLLQHVQEPGAYPVRTMLRVLARASAMRAYRWHAYWQQLGPRVVAGWSNAGRIPWSRGSRSELGTGSCRTASAADTEPARSGTGAMEVQPASSTWDAAA